jgi:uncharacterized protein YjbI with pentapeptide repeats
VIRLSAGLPEDRVIPASEVEAKIKAGEAAKFDNCAIVGDLNLSALTIEQPVHFNYTVFQNSVNFESTIFNSDAYFGYSDFNGTAYFRNSTFKGYANFDDSDFKGDADFWHSTFNRANFNESEFNRYTNFGDSNFNGYATFWYSNFNGYATFRYSNFKDDADFEGSGFYKEANLNDVVFNRNVSFISSQFKGDALFENTTFKSELSLTRARYDKLFIRWNNITRLAYDDSAYMSLMKNFKDLGYLEDYDSCYFQYRKEHRGQPWPAVNDVEEWSRKLIDYPLQWFYGYGTKPFNAVIISVVIIVIFGIFWKVLGLGGPQDLTNASLQPGEEWLDGDITDILGFSVTVFLSGTRFFIDPPALPRIEGRSRSLIKKAFILERLLGALFSILFFIAISGTIVRAA